MIPVYLTISGFLSYQEPVELDFSSFDLACISGSNGAGKSTILDAITWSVFGEARRKDDAVINTHCDLADVRIEFIYENNLYRVQRSKKRGKTTSLEFQVQDEAKNWQSLSEHSVRETDKKIQQTLRMDYDTFINAAFFLQGKADLFAQQRPGERKRILTNILGLEVWDSYRQRASEERKKLDIESSGIEKMLNEILSELELGDQRKARLENLQKELEQAEQIRQLKEQELEHIHRLSASVEEQKRLVDLLSRQKTELVQRIEDHKKDLSERESEQTAMLKQLEDADEIKTGYRTLLKLRGDLEAWDKIAINFQEQDKQRAAPQLEIEKERSRLEENRRNLLEKQNQAESEKQSIPQLETTLKTVSTKIEFLKSEISALVTLRTELDQFKDTEANALAENLKLKSDMKELKGRIDQLQETEGAMCPLCGQPLEKEDRLALIHQLELDGKTMGDQFRKNQAFLGNIDSQKRQMQQDIAGLSEKENNQRDLLRDFDQTTNQLESISKTLEDWGSASKDLEKIEKALSEDDFSLAARKQLAEADAALKEIGYDAAAHDEIRRKETAARVFEAQVHALEAARGAMEPLSREIEKLQKSLNDLDNELLRQDDILKKANTKYEQDAAALPDIRHEEKQLLTLQEAENKLRMQVGGAVQEVKVLDTLKKRKTEYEAEKEILSKRISQYNILERAFSKDGIPALLIEQALPEIEIQANEILDKLTNGAMSVRFQTQRDYKDKKRQDKKETLDILISDSAGVRAYELFSGGEAFRVNFAIRLALSRVLAQRAGARLQTLVIDEGFGSQDAEGRQRLVEAINLVRADFSKILVITHLEELKEAFTTRIEVSKGLQGSQIEVVA